MGDVERLREEPKGARSPQNGPFRLSPRRNGLWALTDSNRRPLPCKGRNAASSCNGLSPNSLYAKGPRCSSFRAVVRCFTSSCLLFAYFSGSALQSGDWSCPSKSDGIWIAAAVRGRLSRLRSLTSRRFSIVLGIAAVGATLFQSHNNENRRVGRKTQSRPLICQRREQMRWSEPLATLEELERETEAEEQRSVG